MSTLMASYSVDQRHKESKNQRFMPLRFHHKGESLDRNNSRYLGAKGLKLILLTCLSLQAMTPSSLIAQNNMVDLAGFNATTPLGFSAYGAVSSDQSGTCVSDAGDVNKDGYADMIIGAPGAGPLGRTRAGTTYVVYGGPSLTNIDFASFTTAQGFAIYGAASSDSSDSSGTCVSGAGDVNKDGYADLIIGAPGAGPLGRTSAGTTYVVYGGPSLTSIDFASFTTAQGFALYGALSSDRSGYSVSGAGDVNKDGYADMIIGAYLADPLGRPNAGTTYVVYGGPSLTNIDFASFTTAQGFALYGAVRYQRLAPSGDRSGQSISGVGDVNNDGYDDVIVGAPSASPFQTTAGATYVVYGGPSLSNIDFVSNFTALHGFALYGAVNNDQSGYSVSGAGDVNKDGYADMIVGASGADPLGRTSAGTTYVVYGGPTPQPPSKTSTSLFTNVLSSTVGANPAGVALADVNKDGKQDILTANSGANTISMLLGYGDGTFAGHQDYQTASGPQGIFVADINHDGNSDIITANAASNTVSTLLGYGNGSYATHQDYLTGANPQKLFAIDLNSDGNLDVVTGNLGASTVSVLLGSSNGALGTHQDYTIGGGAYGVFVMDVNLDGKLDIVTPNGNANTVSVLLGSGNGAFAAHQDYGTGSFPCDLFVTDVNHDGRPDIVTANNGTSTVSVLLGYGNGSFAAHQDYVTGMFPRSTQVLDVNWDGNPDIVTANDGVSGGTVSVSLGYGDGTFFPYEDYATGAASPFGLAAKDVNWDGKPDLVVSDYNNTTAFILLNTYQLPCSLTSVPLFGNLVNGQTSSVNVFSYGMASEDVNLDGKPDVLLVDNLHPEMDVLLGYGNGFFVSSMVCSPGSALFEIITQDVNLDGKPDILGSGVMFLGYGNGSFALPVGLSIGGSGSIWGTVSQDVNLDGKPDLMVSRNSGVSILLGDGNGAFAPPITYAASNSYLIASQDVNLDGKPDLIVPIHAGNIRVFLGYGNGSFALPVTYPTSQNSNRTVGVSIEDVNLDGKPDLLTVGVDVIKGNVMSVLLGYGDGTFASPTTYPGGANDFNPYQITSQDVNLDGKPDVLIPGGVFLGYGNGTFAPQALYPAGFAGRASQDVNLDGRPDVLGVGTSAVSVLLNIYQPVCGAATTTTTSTRPASTSTSTKTLPTSTTSTTTTTVVPTAATSTSTIQSATSTTSSGTATSLTSLASTTATSATQSAISATLSSSTTTIPMTTSTSTSTSTTAAPTTMSSTTTSTTAIPTTTSSTTTSTSTSTQPIATSSTGISMASSATTVSEAQLLTNATSSTPTTVTVASTTTSTETFSSTTVPTIMSSPETTKVPSTSYSTATSTDTTAGPLRTSEETSTMASPSSTSQPTTTSPLVTSLPSITNTTSTTTYNGTLQSGGRTTSNASSWTGVIVGATIGAIAAIGAGYLAYRKWRGHGKGIAPQTKGAAIAAMNAMDSAREENDVSMQANPAYEENPLPQALRAYEAPHIDTWDRDLYNMQENEGKRATIAYDTLQQMPSTYEQPHVDTWARGLYNTQESQESATMYGAPTIPVRDQAYDALQTVTLDGEGYRETNLNPQGSAWSAAYDTIHGGAKPLAYEIILPDQQPWDESTYDLNLPAPGTTGDYIDITVPLDSRV